MSQTKNCKEAMLSYLISLLDDANDFSWSAAKACHAELLCHMEQGITVLTKLEAFFTGTYAPRVLQEMVKHFLILRQNVRISKRLQKTSSVGRQSTHWQKISE